jgi:parallel beta-helix repeat protein
MVDNKYLLTRHIFSDINSLAPGCFVYYNGLYYIRLADDGNPNTQHTVDVYDYDYFLKVGDSTYYQDTKNYIKFSNLTFEKYGDYVFKTESITHDTNKNWEFENVIFQYNSSTLIALDNWYVHNCIFNKNRTSGCQLNGESVYFINNVCNYNGWFSESNLYNNGIIVGPDIWTTKCYINNNTCNSNGTPINYGAGIYLIGQSNNNTIKNNTLQGNSSAGIALFGSSGNLVYNNLITDMPIPNANSQSAAIVVSHAPIILNQAIENFVTFNTVYNCSTPLAVNNPIHAVVSNQYNIITNNLFAAYTNIYNAPNMPIAVILNNGWFCNFISEGLDLLDTNPIKGINPELTENLIPLQTSRLVNTAIPNFVFEDIRGVLRPQGKNPDIGAYERLTYES